MFGLGFFLSLLFRGICRMKIHCAGSEEPKQIRLRSAFKKTPYVLEIQALCCRLNEDLVSFR